MSIREPLVIPEHDVASSRPPAVVRNARPSLVRETPPPPPRVREAPQKTQAKRVAFIPDLVKKYRQYGSPEAVVGEIMRHYKALYDKAIAEGKTRKVSYLIVARGAVSNFKQALRKQNVESEEYLQRLALPKQAQYIVKGEETQRQRDSSIHLTEVPGDAVMEDCRELLGKRTNDKHTAYVVLIALSCLTGRRTIELLKELVIQPPKEPHPNPKYWACITGIAKQNPRDPVMCRDVPFFAPRDDIQDAMEFVRSVLELPPGPEGEDSVSKAMYRKKVNLKYANAIAGAMQKHCPAVGQVKLFRKVYALMSFHYFNQNNCSLVRLASDYLGHKFIATAIPYMNVRIGQVGRLRFP